MTDEPDSTAGIRTPDQRLRVFVSSTLAELADERAAVARAVEALRLTPVLFELGARPHPPRELYRAYLAQSDVFVGLYWERYGWIGPDMDISGLEDEFQLSDSLPRLIYIKVPAPGREDRLTAMIEVLQNEGTESYRSFRDPDELDRLVRDDLALLLSERFLAPPEATAEHDPARPHRTLPAAPTSLLGRDEDIDEVAKLLAAPDVRLVTLTGPGGIGKTRLAVAVARKVQSEYAEDAAFVPLATINQSEFVMPRIAAAVGASVEGARPAIDVIAEHVGDTSVLLVLDNLEQVMGAAAELDQLLARCPGVEILATSRSVLRLRAEREFPVSPLSVPGVDDNPAVEHLASVPAVQLFVERAHAVRHDFALTADNAGAVAEICRRLDGLPLAIELAAARSRLLDPSALLPRLENGLDALGSGPVDLPERQRTLRATVEWSIGLLDDDTREVLTTLSVFVDGWTIEAAMHVAELSDDRALDMLDALAGHSLVRVEPTDLGPRFRMLEPVREIAAELLADRDDCDEVEARHARYFGGLVVRSDNWLEAQGEWGEWLRLDEANIAQAVRWYLANDIRPLPDMFRVLWLQWQVRDRMPEAQGWLEELLQRADVLDAPSRVQLFLIGGVTAGEVGDDATAIALGRRLEQEDIDDPYLESAAQLAFSWIRTIHDDYEGALTAAHLALDGFRTHEALGVVGFAPFITGSALLTVGMIEMSLGQYDTARDHFSEMKDQGDRYGNLFLGSGARAHLAWIAVSVGDLDEARSLLVEALDVQDDDELGTHPLSFCLVSLAKLLMAEGQPGRAATAFGAASGVRKRAGLRPWSSTRRNENELEAQLRRALGSAEYDQAFAAGAALGRAQAISLVRGDG